MRYSAPVLVKPALSAEEARPFCARLACLVSGFRSGKICSGGPLLNWKSQKTKDIASVDS